MESISLAAAFTEEYDTTYPARLNLLSKEQRPKDNSSEEATKVLSLLFTGLKKFIPGESSDSFKGVIGASSGQSIFFEEISLKEGCNDWIPKLEKALTE